MQYLIKKSSKGTLPVNACVLVETLVLGVNKSVLNVLGNLVNSNGNPIGVSAYACKLYKRVVFLKIVKKNSKVKCGSIVLTL